MTHMCLENKAFGDHRFMDVLYDSDSPFSMGKNTAWDLQDTTSDSGPVETHQCCSHHGRAWALLHTGRGWRQRLVGATGR